ncbi:FtsX-like permease family protein [Clostridium sp. MB05]|uniref:FtsX-like permease family protein n=1 Tax=Clostridium sp. MB05 TaxID=3376682 RepID=UPI0039828EDF
MKNRYKVIKIKPIEMLLVTLLEICTVFLIFSTIAQFNFKNNIVENYEKNYPLEDGIYTNLARIVDSEKLDIKEVEDLKLERNLYKFLTTDNDIIDKIYFNSMKYYQKNILDIEKPKEKDLKTKIKDDILYEFSINKAYYDDYIKDYIVGDGFQDEDFINKGKKVPIIMGNSFRKTYEVGQIIKSEALEKDFEVVGFLKKDRFIFASNGTPATGVENLNTAILSPYNEEALEMAIKMNLSMQKEEDRSNEDSLLIYDLTSVIPTMTLKINSNYSLTEAIEKLNNQLLDKGLEVELLTIKSDIDNLLDSFNNEIYFNMLMLSVLGVLSIMILITIINYKIIEFKYNIGILYSIGATTNDVFKIFSYKLLQSSVLALLMGSITYISVKKNVYKFFVNNINVQDILIGSLIYISIIAFSFIVSIFKMKKVTPVELLREGRE